MEITQKDKELILHALKHAKNEEIIVLSNCVWAFINQQKITKKSFLAAMEIARKKQDLGRPSP